MIVQHKNQRVGVFVDVQNLYYSAKSLYGKKINFKNIMKAAVANRQLIRAVAYVITTDERDKQHFYEGLEKIGFELQAKPMQVFTGGAKKGDWDIGIAMDIIRLSSKLDVIVLVSGDGDFRDLLEYCQALGCKTEVIAFGKSCSSKLREVAQGLVDMDKQQKEFLLGPMPVSGPARHKAKDEAIIPIELKGETKARPAARTSAPRKPPVPRGATAPRSSPPRSVARSPSRGPAQRRSPPRGRSSAPRQSPPPASVPQTREPELTDDMFED